MPKITEKFGLIQPEGHEKYDIEVQNKNMATIEEALAKCMETGNGSDTDLSAEQALEAAKQYTDEQLESLVGSAPEALDTIQELANAMEENSDLMEALNQSIGNSAKNVDLEAHKNDTTVHVTAEERTAWNDSNSQKHKHDNKSILDTITQSLITAWNDAVTHITDGIRHVTSADKELWNTVSNKADASSIPTKVSELENDKDYITSSDVDTSQNHVHSNKSVLDSITSSLIDAWNNAVSHITDMVKHITSDERTLWNTVSNKVDKVTGKGLSTNDFTSTEKSKLSGIAEGATKTTVDSALSSTSTNPVQNKVIYAALSGKAASSHGNHVPAVETTDNSRFLRNDNSWQEVTAENIGAAAKDHTHSDYEAKLKTAVFFVRDE